MAAISADFSIKYPQTTYAVKELRHLKSKKPSVFKAFMEDTGIEKTRAEEILTLPNTMVESEPIPKFYLPEVPNNGVYAHYPGVGDGIQLGLRFVLQYEALAGLYGPFDNKRSEREIGRARRNARLLMESKLLHELVHWGRARVSGRSAGPKKGSGEVGWKFEEKAYKSRITAKSLMIQDYFP